MDSDFNWHDRYAGDTAWSEWFDICSVAGCSSASADALRKEIESSLYAQLSRAGYGREDVGFDDPVAFFDAYFKLKGSWEKPKPLKAYSAYRLSVEGIALRDFVCGTLFGSASGRVRDIVTDWIAVHKGWKARTVTGPAGERRHIEPLHRVELSELEGLPANPHAPSGQPSFVAPDDGPDVAKVDKDEVAVTVDF